MGTCKRTRTIVKQIGSQQPIGERLGQPWTKETYMSQKPKRLLVLFPCIWWFTLTPGLQFLLNGISVLRLRKDPGYNRVYIYIVCVYVHMHLYKSIFKYICICKYPLTHTHTHISLYYFICYTNVDHLYIELCIFAQGIPSQPGEPVDSQPLAALELAFFENSRSNVWLCNPTYI